MSYMWNNGVTAWDHEISYMWNNGSLHEIMRSVTCGTMASLHEISYMCSNGVTA